MHPIHVVRGSKEKNGHGETVKRTYEELDIEKYKVLLKNEKVVAMGEIGLDYNDETTEKVMEIAKKQFKEMVN